MMTDEPRYEVEWTERRRFTRAEMEALANGLSTEDERTRIPERNEACRKVLAELPAEDTRPSQHKRPPVPPNPVVRLHYPAPPAPPEDAPAVGSRWRRVKDGAAGPIRTVAKPPRRMPGGDDIWIAPLTSGGEMGLWGDWRERWMPVDPEPVPAPTPDDPKPLTYKQVGMLAGSGSICSECGAVVQETSKHTAWHGRGA